MSARRKRQSSASSSRRFILLLLLALSVILYQDGFDFPRALLRASQAFSPFRLTQTRLLSLPAFSAWQISTSAQTLLFQTEEEARLFSKNEDLTLLTLPEIPLQVTGSALQIARLEEMISSLNFSLSLLSSLSAFPDDIVRARASAALPALDFLLSGNDVLFPAPLPPEAAGLFSLLDAARAAFASCAKDGKEAAQSAFSSLALQFFVFGETLSLP